MTTYLQNTSGLSGTVAYLGLRPRRVRQDRLVSAPVVVRFGGQLSPCRLDAARPLLASALARGAVEHAKAFAGKHRGLVSPAEIETRGLVRAWTPRNMSKLDHSIQSIL